MPRFSICIPYHDTPRTAFFLSRLLHSLSEQTFTDYEIVLTKEGKMAENTNAAMRKAKGELIKILYMDDYLAHPDALKIISDSFENKDMWLATGCLHQREDGINYEDPHSAHYPEYTQDISTGNNRIGSPSVITLRRKGMLFFDEHLSFLLDCELYNRYYATYGEPKLVNDLGIVIGIHDGQVSNLMSPREKLQELNYVKKKHV